jgi:hypothetical protein
MDTENLQPGTILRHFSGDCYRVIAVGVAVNGTGSTENVGELTVTYRGLYTSAKYGKGAVWTRTYTNLTEHIIANDLNQPRFVIVRLPGFIRRRLSQILKTVF